MKNKNIVFLGTPEFAACVLEGLLKENYNIIAVVTQPDKPVGRKKVLTPTPVKVVAQNYNIPVYQPISLRKDYEFLKEMDIDMLITTAYGQILPPEVLQMSKINNINVHASLLPKHRGGAPIHRSIINGDKVTGVTIMEMVDKMDAGKMYAKQEYVIDDEINTTQLFDKLQYVGRDLLLKVLPDLLENKIEGEEQNEDEVTFSWNIKREEEKIDFSKTCLEVHNLIRGLAEVPGAYCYFKNQAFKIYKAKVYSIVDDEKEVGTLRIENKNRLIVKCKDGYVELLEIKLEGKQRMDVKSFLNGCNKDDLIKEKLS
ncbi:MAG: methionyl-tRNA formyltransferase [Bacilli bacterium]|nr:methionyl-tRNA formyltransferase [Bacilli bacterium]